MHGGACINVALAHRVLLGAARDRVGRLGHGEGIVDGIHAVLHQFVLIEFDGVCVLVVDGLPQLLELRFVPIRVEAVVVDLLVGGARHMVVRGAVHHALQAVVDGCDERILIGRFANGLRQAGDEIRILTDGARGVFAGWSVCVVEVIRLVQVLVDDGRFLRGEFWIRRCGELRAQCCRRNGELREEVVIDLGRALSQGLGNVFLQVRSEFLIAFRSDDGECVDVEEQLLVAEGLLVLAHAVVVDAQTQATAHLLTLADFVRGIFERADLEHVGVVPAFAQRRMAEDETHWFVEAQQTFLVAQNEVIRAFVIADILSAFDPGIGQVLVLVHAEVTRMHAVHIAQRAAQIVEIAGVVAQAALRVQPDSA